MRLDFAKALAGLGRLAGGHPARREVAKPAGQLPRLCGGCAIARLRETGTACPAWGRPRAGVLVSRSGVCRQQGREAWARGMGACGLRFREVGRGSGEGTAAAGKAPVSRSGVRSRNLAGVSGQVACRAARLRESVGRTGQVGGGASRAARGRETGRVAPAPVRRLWGARLRETGMACPAWGRPRAGVLVSRSGVCRQQGRGAWARGMGAASGFAKWDVRPARVQRRRARLRFREVGCAGSRGAGHGPGGWVRPPVPRSATRARRGYSGGGQGSGFAKWGAFAKPGRRVGPGGLPGGSTSRKRWPDWAGWRGGIPRDATSRNRQARSTGLCGGCGVLDFAKLGWRVRPGGGPAPGPRFREVGCAGSRGAGHGPRGWVRPPVSRSATRARRGYSGGGQGSGFAKWSLFAKPKRSTQPGGRSARGIRFREVRRGPGEGTAAAGRGSGQGSGFAKWGAFAKPKRSTQPGGRSARGIRFREVGRGASKVRPCTGEGTLRRWGQGSMLARRVVMWAPAAR